ncbi:MAG TPA: hypothetical protein VG649_03245 [Candidatus Angelobacter sp.]|jgi:hypothetical protein|nr:hypothetical protein [Candidatus Angelobacter sp.]
MYYRKISIQYQHGSELLPCPIKWLDNFSMRNFTNDSIFDDTLPVSDGLMEIGTRVPLQRLQEAMEDWFQRKSYLPKGGALALQEVVPSDHPSRIAP